MKMTPKQIRSNLRKEAQAINERNRVPGDPHYKEPLIKVRSVKHETFEAYYAAIAADDAWQEELDSRGIERYSKEAKGATVDSDLRRLYEAKIAADDKYRELVETMRRYQDPRQVGLPE